MTPSPNSSVKVRLLDVCMVVITIFIILAYFNGWG